jgi:hypothetical protein
MLDGSTARAYSIMPFVWSIGTIIGPSIGGCLADPAESFPSLFSSSGLFAQFPYLLPNLVCALLLVIAIVAGYCFLDETHPDKQSSTTQRDRQHSTAVTPLLPAQGGNEHAPVNLATESYGTFDQVDIERDEIWQVRSNGEWIQDPTQEDKAVTKPVIMFVAALGIFTYHSMTYDHLLPIFLQDKRADDVSAYDFMTSSFAGGLGLSVQDVGIIMSLNGVIALFVQAVIFPFMASWFGIWKLLVLVTFGHPLSYFIVPYLALLPIGWLHPAIYACLAIRNCFSIIAYPLLLILIKEAAPSPSHLGKINGLAASTGAACRTVASPIAGLLYGRSIELHFTPLAWWASSLVALVGTFQIPFLAREARKLNARVHISARGYSKERTAHNAVVRINIEDVD